MGAAKRKKSTYYHGKYVLLLLLFLIQINFVPYTEIVFQLPVYI